MSDRKKVENGVHHCGEMHICKGCPYRGHEDCTDVLLRDCMELIRKLENGRDGGTGNPSPTMET
jgi:hypothetical protein